MSTSRIDSVNSLLKREVSKILQREISFPAGILVTLTKAEATANLIEAKIYISAFPEDKSEDVLKILKKEVPGIQKEINKKLNMRPVPKIIFVLDKNSSAVGRVEELLNQLKNK